MATCSCAAFLALTISTSSCQRNKETSVRNVWMFPTLITHIQIAWTKYSTHFSNVLLNFASLISLQLLNNKPPSWSASSYLVPLHTVFLASARDGSSNLLPAFRCADWVGLQGLFQKFLFFCGPGGSVPITTRG